MNYCEVNRNNQIDGCRRKLYGGLSLLQIPNRRSKAAHITASSFPADLDESFHQGELSLPGHEKKRFRQKLHKTNNPYQKQYHYLSAPWNKDNIPTGNKFVVGKDYSKRQTEKCIKRNQIVPDLDKLYNDIEREFCKDESQLQSELESDYQKLDEKCNLQYHKLDEQHNPQLGIDIDKNVTEFENKQGKYNTNEIMGSFGYEGYEYTGAHFWTYNKTSTDIYQTVAETKSMQYNCTEAGNCAEKFSSTFDTSSVLKENVKENVEKESSKWLTSRKQSKKSLTSGTEDNVCRKMIRRYNDTEISKARELWCYVNEDCLIGQVLPGNVRKDTSQDTLLGNSQFNLTKSRTNESKSSNGFKTKQDQMIAEVSIDETVIKDGNLNKNNLCMDSGKELSENPAFNQCKKQNIEEKQSERKVLKEIYETNESIVHVADVPFEMKGGQNKYGENTAAEFHAVQYSADFTPETTEDYIPSSQMPSFRKNVFDQAKPTPVIVQRKDMKPTQDMFSYNELNSILHYKLSNTEDNKTGIGTNTFKVDNFTADMEISLKSSKTSQELPCIQFSEDNDMVSDSQNKTEDSAKDSLLIFQYNKSYVKQSKLLKGRISKDVEAIKYRSDESSEKAPENQILYNHQKRKPSLKELQLVFKVTGSTSDSNIKQSNHCGFNNINIMKDREAEPVIKENLVDDDIIPSSGNSVQSNGQKCIPEICRFLENGKNYSSKTEQRMARL